MRFSEFLKETEKFISQIKLVYDSVVEVPSKNNKPKTNDANPSNLRDSEMLSRFLNNIHSSKDISDQHSKSTIEDNVILINGKTNRSDYVASGILISEDGYFITAKHCVKDKGLKPLSINCRGINYEFDQVCVSSKSQDIALAKAKIPKKSKELNFKISNDYTFNKRTPVVAISRMSGYLEFIGGFVSDVNGSVYTEKGLFDNHINLNMPIKQGHSGSPAVLLDGSLVGIISTGALNKTLGSCAKSRSVLDLISKYAVYLKN